VVEDFFTLPNWKGSMYGITIGASQLKTKDSRILLNTAVRDIGLRSVSIDFGLEIFPNGRTSAHFHSPGTRPSLIEELNMEHTGMLIVVAQVFKSQLGITQVLQTCDLGQPPKQVLRHHG
jgi:hypothetical protein